jgi:hypothetical protein
MVWPGADGRAGISNLLRRGGAHDRCYKTDMEVCAGSDSSATKATLVSPPASLCVYLKELQ